MLNILNNFKKYEIDFQGIKIFNYYNPTKLIKQLFLSNSIKINYKDISQSNIIYINELTKANNFISLTKNGQLFKAIFMLLEQYPIINYKNIEKITKTINDPIKKFEILESNVGDMNKIINIMFEVIDLGYLTKEIFAFLLDNNYFDQGKLFIFDNIEWVNFNFLQKYLNMHNFIIVTSDFRRNIKQIDELELITIFDDEFNYVDFCNLEQIIDYIEKNINEEFNHKKFFEVIKNKNSFFSLKVFSLLNQIISKI